MSVPWDDFIDWAEVTPLQDLPPPWQAKTKVTIEADKKLAQYLKDSKGTRAKNAFALMWRYCRAWPFTVAFTVEAAFKIERLGWVPETVDVYVRHVRKKESS